MLPRPSVPAEEGSIRLTSNAKYWKMTASYGSPHRCLATTILLTATFAGILRIWKCLPRAQPVPDVRALGLKVHGRHAREAKKTYLPDNHCEE